MIFSSPPQFGQWSISNTRLSSLAQLSRTGWWCAQFAKRSYADTKRISCSLGLGTKAASHCMNSSGHRTRGVVPSRQEVFSLSTSWPAALICTRSLAKAGRAMWRHSCSSACQ